MISFARGAPAPECLDAELLADCARAAVLGDPGVLAYGPGGGYEPLRAWLGARHGVDAARVVVTNGGLQGFVFYAEELLAERPGRVLVEAPTYDRPLKILARLGAEIVPVAMDAEGLDPDALERELRGGETSFLYTIPTFQNPSGRTLSTERRRRVVELAREHGVPVLEDDPYGLVRYEGEPPPSLHELEGGDLVTYASSFSKTVAPGVRVGWFAAPADAGRADRGARRLELHLAAVPDAGDGLRADRPRRLRAEPGADPRAAEGAPRRDARGARAASSPVTATWSEPEGGYFLWVDLPVDAADLLVARRGRRRHLRQGRRLLLRREREPLGAARVQLRVAVGDRRGRLDARLAPARLTAPVQLREQHAADEAGEEREQDHPDQRGARLAEDEVDRGLLVVAGDERDQVAADQDEQRRPGSRAAAASCGRTRRAATP